MPDEGSTFINFPREAERAKDKPDDGPARSKYWHTKCNRISELTPTMAKAWRDDPKLDAVTWCTTCREHGPVGADGDFHWLVGDEPSPADDPKVGTHERPAAEA